MAAGWFEEMKQRRVFRALVGYGIVSFAILQIVEPIMHGLSLPEWVLAATVIALGLGFPIALVLAWVFDVNAGRIETAGPRPRAGLVLLLIALGVALGAPGVGWYFWKHHRATAAVEAAKATPAAPLPGPKSIAVLPFVNMSAEAENEFFSDGLSEEILNSLARIDTLQVVGRTSSFQFKGKSADLRSVGSALGVATVLEGSVRRGGDRARVTAQLVRVADGFHLWSQTYDRTLTDALAVQLDIAEHVAAALDVLLDDAQRERLKRAGVKSVDAFVAYQKGIRLYDEAHGPRVPDRRIETLRRANEEFARAAALEPEFALAHYWSTDLYDHILLDSSDEAARAPALTSVRRELDLASEQCQDPVQRLVIEAERQILSDDWRGLKARLEAAYAAKGCAEANWIGPFGIPFGLSAEIVALGQRLIACDPLKTTNYTTTAQASAWAGRPEQTLALEAAFEKATGGASPPSVRRIQALVALGRLDEARDLLRTLTGGGTKPATTAEILAAAAFGEDAAALRKRIQRLPGDAARNPLVEWYAAVLTGDRAEANRLSAAVDAGPAGPLLLAVRTGICMCGAPFDLEATPNFKARLAESGLPWPPVDASGNLKRAQEGGR